MRRSKKPLVYDLSTVKSLPTFKTCSVSIAAPPIQSGCSWFRALVDFFFAFLGQNDIETIQSTCIGTAHRGHALIYMTGILRQYPILCQDHTMAG